MTESTPAKLFPTAALALASPDRRKMFEMSFKGVKGSIFIIASTEHQAKLAMLENVVTVKKVNAAERGRMLAAAFSEMMTQKNEEKADAPTEHSPREQPPEERTPDARSSPSEQAAAV
jgi:hypothetical protein